MNNTAAIVGGVVVVLILLGGVFWYTQNNPSPTATSTPVGTTNGTGTTPKPQVKTPGAPVATTNATVNPTATSAVVVGGVVPNGALTTYWYEYGTSANLGLTSTAQTIGSGYANLAAPAYIAGLTKSTNYYFRLVAQNSVGKSVGTTYTFRTDASTPSPVGSAPVAKTIAATNLSRTSAQINGEVTPNKVATNYWFEYGTSANLGEVSTVRSAGDGSAKISESVSLSSLAPATTHYFRLNAQNQFGTANGTILTFTTAGPPLTAVPVVTTLVAGPVATTTATLRGTVNPSSIQTTYWFEYSTDSSFATALKTTTHRSAGKVATTVSIEANVTALRANTNYYYRTVAQSSAGTVRGEVINFKTK